MEHDLRVTSGNELKERNQQLNQRGTQTAETTLPLRCKHRLNKRRCRTPEKA